jgi:hypothetical protein
VTAAVDEMAVYTETVDPDVAAAFAKYAVDGDPVALTSLILRAHWLDQPLCGAARCWTPHNLTYRPCCETHVCDDDQPEHDEHCTEFVAQMREESL